MASIRQSIRSSTASKRPTSAIADGQIALNTASGTPGMFFKDSAGNIIKAGPAHYGASAPNSSPAVGGSTGNSIGEAWLDNSLTPAGWKVWSGSAWVNATPLSSVTVQGLVELATDAETQAGIDTARAVTSASLQSKVSDSISTTSASGIASSTAVKTAYDLANAALPKSGGIVTGNLEIGTTGSFTFEGSSADGFETTLAVVNPTADRTITFPNVTGTVVTTGDSGTVTGTMIADNTIVNAEIGTTAAIAFSKLASLTSANILLGNASGVPTATAVTGDVTITNSGVTAIASNVIVNADINSAAAIAYSKLALSSGITNTDVNASAAIAGTKISPNFGSQNLTTTGNITAANYIAASGTAAAPSIAFSGDTNTGIYSPGADQLAISTNSSQRLLIDSAGNVGVGISPSYKFDVAGALRFRSQGYLYDSAGTSQLIRLTEIGARDARMDAFNGTDFNGTLRYAGANLVFETGTGASVTERLRITSAGLVGIGTSSPSVRLEVLDSIAGGSGGTVATLHNVSDTGGDTRYSGLNFVIGSDNGTSAIRAARTNSSTNYETNLSFWTNPTGATQTPVQRMTLDSTGRLGIGTPTPNVTGFGSTVATINVATASNGGLELTKNNVAAGHFTVEAGANNDIRVGAVGGSAALTFQTGGSERARIDSSGRLLVGGSSDSGGALLQVVGDRIRVGTAKTPASASATGSTGEICWDANYIYVCTATNTWKRTAIATW